MSETAEENNTIQWTHSIDTLLAKWCDEAKCFEWMHIQAYNYYDSKSRILIITSNVLTSISGLINLIVGGITIQGFQTAWVFGTISIIISITNMLQEKLSYNSLATEHKNYSMMWGIIRRKIEEELVIPPLSRKQCATFLKFVREDINKVSLDGNTKIPEKIRLACLEKFGKIEKFEVPDICGSTEHTFVYSTTVEVITKPLLE